MSDEMERRAETWGTLEFEKETCRLARETDEGKLLTQCQSLILHELGLDAESPHCKECQLTPAGIVLRTSIRAMHKFAEQVRLATLEEAAKAQPYLYEALSTCANRDWDSTTSEAYRLIEAAMVLLGCHPTGRTLEQVAQSTHAKAVAAIRALAGGKG